MGYYINILYKFISHKFSIFNGTYSFSGNVPTI